MQQRALETGHRQVAEWQASLHHASDFLNFECSPLWIHAEEPQLPAGLLVHAFHLVH